MMALPMKKMFCALLAALILCGALGGCTQPSEPDGGLQIVATLFPQYDFARTLAGGRANVSLLLSPVRTHILSIHPPKTSSPSQARISLFTPETIWSFGRAACWKARMWRARWSRAV